MLNSIIIGGDLECSAYLRQVCADFADICIYKVLGPNARLHEVIVTLNTYEPDVAFLDISDLGDENSFASACLQELLVKHAETAVVPFCRGPRIVPLDDLASLGPVLTPPFSAEQLELTVRGALRMRRSASKRVSTVVAFLPSKPGAGATTVALHTALAAASTLGKKSLLVEADLNSGSIAYMLGVQLATPASEAIESHRLTDAQWNRCVDQTHGFDILPAWGGPSLIRGTRWDFFRLLKFARERYDVVVVDLPEAIDEISASIIAEADQSVMVCTPEVASLSMVRRRVREMDSHGVSHSHMQLAVNRYVTGDAELTEMGQIAQREISVVLPDDLHAVKCANRRRGLVASNSKFWRSVVSFTHDLLGAEEADDSHSAAGFFRKTVGSLFGASTPDALQTTARTRGGRL